MALEKVYDQTVAIKELLDACSRKKRDDVIAQLQDLLVEREKCLKQLPKTCSGDERALGEEIMAMNREIDQALQAMRADIIQDMNQFRHRKRTVNRYRNPYTGPTKDGMYMDKRE